MLQHLPIFSYPFDVSALPANGIYFFYEKGGIVTHFESQPRIVRVARIKMEASNRESPNTFCLMKERCNSR